MSNESRPGGDATHGSDDTIVDDPSVRDHPRYHQMFPVLTDVELDRVHRFGKVSRYAQGELLYQLILKDGSDQNTLAENLGVTKASLSNLLDGMQELDLIKRVPHPEDSRLKQIYLTPHAREVITKLGSIWSQLESRMNEGFSKVEVDLLENWLRRIQKNLEDS